MKQYIIYAYDAKDEQALERRMAVRPAHFEGARALKASGNFVIGGAILDESEKMIGSMMVLQFETAEALEEWKENEPYIKGKVWENIKIHAFRKADV